MRNGEDAHDLLKMFYNSLDLASSSKVTAYQSIRSFYSANRVTLGEKSRALRGSIEYEPRKLYTQDEVAMLVDTATDVRDKALITFLAQSGQRIGVITSLKFRHIDLEQSTPIIIEVPAILRDKHGANVNKAQKQYRFAVGADAKEYLRLMIEDREERGESLGPDNWLFRSHSTRIGDKEIRKVKRSEPGEPLSKSQVGNIVRRAAERRGIQQRYGKRYLFHPHGFRRYWKHQLRMGGMDSNLLDFMMGHALPYGGAYDRWTLEDIRGQYRQAENYLSLHPLYALNREELREEVLRVLLGKISRARANGTRYGIRCPYIFPIRLIVLLSRVMTHTLMFSALRESVKLCIAMKS